MKKLWLLFLFILLLTVSLLTVPAKAADVPEDLTDAAPEQAEELLEDMDFSADSTSFASGITAILQRAWAQAGEILRTRIRDAALILLVVVLCSAIDGFQQGTGQGTALELLPMAGALSVTALAAGSLHALIGLGADTIDSLNAFSKVLLPTLAAATAAGGAVGTATVQQITTVFFADLLLNLINGLLLPMVYLYIGALTADAILPEGSLGGIAEAIKKVITWVLSASLIAFTLYLSIVHVIAGTADTATVKIAKAAIAGAVPVVGSILSEASETVLAGAGLLKNTIGIFGMLAILATCAYPFLQLGLQYLLYKLTGFLAATVGMPKLCQLIDRLGGAFGLVLGMTGACAVVLLVSVLSSVAAVTG